MPVKLDKFGSTAISNISTTDFVNSRNVSAVPIDPRLESLLNNSRNSDPQVSSTLPDGSKPTSKGNLSTVEQKIYQAVAQGNKLAEKITGPLQKFYSTVGDIDNSIEGVKGVLGERGSIQRAINQVGQLIGVDILSLKKENKYVNQQQSPDGGVVSPLNYPYPRIAWEITTQWRLLQGLPPIKFYVNPATMTISQTQLLQKDLVQKGYIINSWKDVNVEAGNRFPIMDITFDFQSSNILPESYVKTSSEYAGTTNSANALDILKQTVGIGESSINIDAEYNIPPGLLNFFNILTIFHEDKSISKLKMYSIANSLNNNSPLSISDLSQIKTEDLNPEIERLAGIPNYVYLSISTRVWPKMTLKGFFEGGYSLSLNATDPFRFNTGLKFSAFESDPAWWDTKAIRDSYLNFYKKASSKLGEIPAEELAPEVKQPWIIPPDIYLSAAKTAEANEAAQAKLSQELPPISPEPLDSLPKSINISDEDLKLPEVVPEVDSKGTETPSNPIQDIFGSNATSYNYTDPAVIEANEIFTAMFTIKDIDTTTSEKSELSEFKKAFKEARKKLGKGKIFEFKGKKYSTNYKEEESQQNVTNKSQSGNTATPGVSTKVGSSYNSNQKISNPKSSVNTTSSRVSSSPQSTTVASAVPKDVAIDTQNKNAQYTSNAPKVINLDHIIKKYPSSIIKAEGSNWNPKELISSLENLMKVSYPKENFGIAEVEDAFDPIFNPQVFAISEATLNYYEKLNLNRDSGYFRIQKVFINQNGKMVGFVVK